MYQNSVRQTVGAIKFNFDRTFREKLMSALREEYKFCPLDEMHDKLYELWITTYTINEVAPQLSNWSVEDLVWFAKEIKEYPYLDFVILKELVLSAQERAIELGCPTLLHKSGVSITD